MRGRILRCQMLTLAGKFHPNLLTLTLLNGLVRGQFGGKRT